MLEKAIIPEGMNQSSPMYDLFTKFNSFLDSCDNANEVNENLLMQILKDNSQSEFGKEHNFESIETIEDFKEKVPLSTYDDYFDAVERMTHGEKNVLISEQPVFYAVSSGSLGVPKHIPIVPEMIKTYLVDLGTASAYIKTMSFMERFGRPPRKGKNFNGSLIEVSEVPDGTLKGALSSGVYNKLKDQMKKDLPWPVEVTYPEGRQIDFKYLRAFYGLKNKSIVSMSAPFVTALVDTMHFIVKNWEMLVNDIEKGKLDESVKIDSELREKFESELEPAPERAQELREIFEKGEEKGIIPKIWPEIELVQCVMGGGFSIYTQKLREYLGDGISIYSSLYSCSEGVLGVPTGFESDEYILFPSTTFYEFIPAEDDSDNPETLMLKDLEVGKDYEVVLTNRGGLYRYRLGDILEVTGFQGEMPIIRFKYRKKQMVNLAGEKTNESHLSWVISEIENEKDNFIRDYSIYADTQTLPGRYILLLETDEHVPKDQREEYGIIVEQKLEERNPSYGSKVQNELILPMETLFVQPETYYLYRDILIYNGASENQLKPVRIIDTPRKEKFFFSLLDEEE